MVESSRVTVINNVWSIREANMCGFVPHVWLKLSFISCVKYELTEFKYKFIVVAGWRDIFKQHTDAGKLIIRRC